MKTSVKLITPEYAKKLLEKNNINRIASLPAVNEYARQMTAGLWCEETGESIKIADDGTLVDGQQRLMAIIKANISLNFLIIEGLEKSSFKFIDTGKKRTAADAFTIAGISDANNIAAGIKRYIMLKSGNSISNSHGVGLRNYSSAELLSLYMKRADFWRAAYLMCDRWYNHSGRLLFKADFMGFYSFFFDIHEDDAFSFMDMIGEGAELTINNPIRLLRNKLMEARLNTRFNLTGYTKTALVIKAWNYFRNNETPKILKIDPKREEMPIAI